MGSQVNHSNLTAKSLEQQQVEGCGLRSAKGDGEDQSHVPNRGSLEETGFRFSSSRS